MCWIFRNRLIIKLKSSTLVSYRKLGKSAHIDCELLYPQHESHGIVLYISDLQNWDDGSEISLEEKTMVYNDLKKDFHAHGYQVHFD